MNVEEIREELMKLAEPEYGEFILRGAPTDYPVLGVRIPQITEIAKRILDSEKIKKLDSKQTKEMPELKKKENTVKLGSAEEILSELEPKSREEMHLFSMILCGIICQRFKKKDFLAKKIIEEEKPRMLLHISKMDSWEFTDIFMSRLKCVKKAREEWLDFIDELLDKDEFYTRVGLVLLIGNYVEPDWIQMVFERVLKVSYRDEYYVKMATAWLLQVCYVKFPDLTFSFLKTAKIPEWILRKTVAKIQDSYRVDTEWKERAKELCQ